MAWIAPSGSNRWLKRMALNINHLSGSNTEATIDLAAAPDWFWDNVAANGSDLRVTKEDGTTAVVFERTGWNQANKTGTLNLDPIAPVAATIYILWLYWDQEAVVSDASVSVTISSADTGYVEPAYGPHTYIVRARPEPRGATKPRADVVKALTETIFVWWDLRRLLARASHTHNGATLWEEVQALQFDVLLSDSDQAGLKTEADTRLVGPWWARTTVKAGATDTDYTLSLTVNTSEGLTYNPRALLRVVKPDED